MRDPPLFDAFKTFCVDTDANPEAVKTAVEAAGGKLHAQGSTDWPFAMTTRSWDISQNGHNMTISTGTQHIRSDQMAAHPSPIDSTDCIINEYGKDDAGVSAIQKWVGVPPGSSSGKAGPYTLNGMKLPAITIYFYGYQIVGKARVAVMDQASLRSAQKEGRYWSLVLIKDSHGASLQFVHELPEPQNENSSGQ